MSSFSHLNSNIEMVRKNFGRPTLLDPMWSWGSLVFQLDVHVVRRWQPFMLHSSLPGCNRGQHQASTCQLLGAFMLAIFRRHTTCRKLWNSIRSGGSKLRSLQFAHNAVSLQSIKIHCYLNIWCLLLLGKRMAVGGAVAD